MPAVTSSPLRFLLIILTLLVSLCFSVPAQQRGKEYTGDPIDNIKSALASCEADLADVQDKARHRCPKEVIRPDGCSKLKELKDVLEKKLDTPVNLPDSLRQQIYAECSQVKADVELCIQSPPGNTPGLKDFCERRKLDKRACDEKLAVLTRPGPYPLKYVDPAQARQVQSALTQAREDHSDCMDEQAAVYQCALLMQKASSISQGCADIRASLREAQAQQASMPPQVQPPPSAQPEASAEIRLHTVGREPDTAGQNVTYRADILRDPTRGGGRLAYLWLVNGQEVSRGWDQSTITFPVPGTGVTKVAVRIIRVYDDRGRADLGWGEDQLWVQNKPDPYAHDMPPAPPPGANDWTLVETISDPEHKSGDTRLDDNRPNNKSNSHSIATNTFTWKMKYWEMSQDGKNTPLFSSDCDGTVTFAQPPGSLKPGQEFDLAINSTMINRYSYKPCEAWEARYGTSGIDLSKEGETGSTELRKFTYHFKVPESANQDLWISQIVIGFGRAADFHYCRGGKCAPK